MVARACDARREVRRASEVDTRGAGLARRYTACLATIRLPLLAGPFAFPSSRRAPAVGRPRLAIEFIESIADS